MESFRVGTDRPPVYTMSWKLSVQNRTFPCIHAWTVPNDSLSPFIRNKKILEKVFPPYTRSLKHYPKLSSRVKFPAILLSSVEFPLALLLRVLDGNGSGCVHENFLVRFHAWTRSGTASISVWNGSISSRVNARPISTVLVRFHLEPFLRKQG